MTAEARLKRPQAALQYAWRARKYYAQHLGLKPVHTEQFVAWGYFEGEPNEYAFDPVIDGPWLYYLLGPVYGPRIPRNQSADAAIPSEVSLGWEEFIEENHESVLRALAQILLVNGQPTDAANDLAKLILWARRYEMIYPPRIEVVWPRFLLGECYRAIGSDDQALEVWRSACSIEHCVEGDLNDIDNAGLPWVKRAKESLMERNCSFASSEVSRNASTHLVRSIRYMLEAESLENRGETNDDLFESVRSAGQGYTNLLAKASEEIAAMEGLDRFALGRVNINGGPVWFRVEAAKEQLLHKNALVYLSKGQVAAAIVCYKEGTTLWPTATGYSALAELQMACGLHSDAKATYDTLVRGAQYIGSTETSESCEEKIADARHILRELG